MGEEAVLKEREGAWLGVSKRSRGQRGGKDIPFCVAGCIELPLKAVLVVGRLVDRE